MNVNNQIYIDENGEFYLTLYKAVHPITNEERILYYPVDDKSTVYMMGIEEFSENFSRHDPPIEWDGDPEEMLKDLTMVGKEKSVGYLAVEDIEYCGSSLKGMLLFAEDNGLKYVIETQSFRKGDEFLYLYDEQMLRSILTQNHEDLEKAGIPTRPLEYIRYIARISVSENEHPEAFRVIAKTFGQD